VAQSSEFNPRTFTNVSSGVDLFGIIAWAMCLAGRLRHHGGSPPSQDNDGNQVIIVCSHINISLKVIFVLCKVVVKIARSKFEKFYRKLFVCSRVVSCLRTDGRRAHGAILIDAP
jgi:hypothetical protein